MLSDNIRKYRKKSNMSQDELAEKLAVTRQSVSLWETGQTQPSLDNIVALSKLFNISTDDLLTDDTCPSDNTEPNCAQPDSTPKKKKSIFVPIICAVAAVLVIFAVLFNLGVFDSKNKNEVSSETQEAVSNKEGEDIQHKEDAPVKDDTSNKEVPTVGKAEASTSDKDIYGYLKNFVIENGKINGDYCYYSKSADNYGGYSSENFSLYYWGDSGKIEFCLHSVIDDTFSINFYLYVPQKHTGEYEYISSYYYRDSGEPLYEARGIISADEFTKNYPLNCTKYIGSTSEQNEFMEMSRVGICDLIDCLKKFITVEKLYYSFSDFGFAKF